ncbi:ATP-binding protein [Sagittula sp. SSi028]|uniref:PAS domain-containing sensor histidine kinase n=1 Tax=Sagittula sp. SSi028 TaxID=3400636 RepID=UPI003AF41130
MPHDFAILDHIAQPVFVLRIKDDGTPVYCFWNRACETHGHRARADVIGRSALEVYAGPMGEAAYARHLEAMQSDRPLHYDVLLDLAETPTEIHTILSPLRDDDGALTHIIGTSVLLASLRALQKREVETLGLVERARSEMEQYLAFAAHDLRAPMRRIEGLAEMLREDLPENAKDAMEIAQLMQQVSNKAQLLINEVLKFTEASNASQLHETFDVGLLARDIFLVLDPMRLHDLKAPSVMIHGDRVAIQIILRNLVDNAIKHANRDVVKVRIGAETAPNGDVILTVTDNGPGLPDGSLDFLTGWSVDYGKGFGLLGLRRMIRLRGGSIAAENAPDGGTCFRITLPAVPVPAEE